MDGESTETSGGKDNKEKTKKELASIYRAFILGKRIPKWRLCFLLNRIAGLYGMYCVFNERTKMYYIHCREADYVYSEKDEKGEEHCKMTFVEHRKSSVITTAESFYDMLKNFYTIFELKYTGKLVRESIKTMKKPDYNKAP